jgi:hypothetical protein
MKNASRIKGIWRIVCLHSHQHLRKENNQQIYGYLVWFHVRDNCMCKARLKYHHGDPGSIPCNYIWVSWWAKWPEFSFGFVP